MHEGESTAETSTGRTPERKNAYYNYLKNRKADYSKQKQMIKDEIASIYHLHNSVDGYRTIHDKVFDDKLKQNFKAEEINQKWCTDFTNLFLADSSKRYNCSIIDLQTEALSQVLPISTLQQILQNGHYKKPLTRSRDLIPAT